MILHKGCGARLPIERPVVIVGARTFQMAGRLRLLDTDPSPAFHRSVYSTETSSILSQGSKKVCGDVTFENFPPLNWAYHKSSLH